MDECCLQSSNPCLEVMCVRVCAPRAARSAALRQPLVNGMRLDHSCVLDGFLVKVAFETSARQVLVNGGQDLGLGVCVVPYVLSER